MPCYGPEPTAEEIARDWEARLRHDSPTADALCELCQYMEQNRQSLTPKAQLWWQEHKERDRERVAKEFAEQKTRNERQALLDRLTPYERRLLGVSES